MLLQDVKLYKNSKTEEHELITGEITLEETKRNNRVKCIYNESVYWVNNDDLPIQPESKIIHKICAGETIQTVAIKYSLPLKPLIEKYGIFPKIGTEIII